MACVPFALALVVLNVGAAWLAVRDKKVARSHRGDLRVPEQAFLLLAAIGAGPGLAWTFHHKRHKIRKVRFMVLFWLTVAVSIPLTYGWGIIMDCW